MLFKYLKIINY